MAQTYLLFDFGADEQKAQQARHKLEGWKQAFRLDKKLQFKFDRGTGASSASETQAKPAAQKSKPRAGAKSKPSAKPAETPAESNGSLRLLVRLYFSAHEKLSEKRWIERIPDEAPFKDARPKIVQEGQTEFAEILNQFDALG